MNHQQQQMTIEFVQKLVEKQSLKIRLVKKEKMIHKYVYRL